MTDLPPGAAPSDEAPGIRILAQYIRDLSFESPHAPESLRGGPSQPQIDLGVELNARGRPDGFYEVELKLNARATRDAQPVFVVELVYAGLFQINVQLPADCPADPQIQVGYGSNLSPGERYLPVE